MELTVLSNGLFGSNTYILEEKGECAVIDCGVSSGNILKIIREKGLKVRYIILTHGHVDHIYHAGILKETANAELCIHEEELPLYSDPDKNGCTLFGFGDGLKLSTPDRLLQHGDILPLGEKSIEIIHTPGHSPGSISILCENMLFSGDTLFSLSVGRTDLFGGSPQKLVESIKERLYSLNGDTRVYPGHGPSTTIAYERENNPYV